MKTNIIIPFKAYNKKFYNFSLREGHRPVSKSHRRCSLHKTQNYKPNNYAYTLSSSSSLDSNL